MTSCDDNEQPALGPLPPAIRQLLQDGMAAHFTDRERAESLFRQAVTQAPDFPAAHRCLVKHYNRCRQFDKALAAAKDWASAAAQKAALPDDWQQWQQAPGPALAAQKGLAFIYLRNGQPAAAEAATERVLAHDTEDGVVGSVIACSLQTFNSYSRDFWKNSRSNRCLHLMQQILVKHDLVAHTCK